MNKSAAEENSPARMQNSLTHITRRDRRCVSMIYIKGLVLPHSERLGYGLKEKYHSLISDMHMNA
jgi:hypothetical protein